MNQGKLDMIKQEVARVNINILGISGLKWMGIGKFNSDDHYIYYCGQESLRRNGVATHSQQKSLRCSTWVQSQKWQDDLDLFPRQTIQQVIQVYAPITKVKQAEVDQFHEDLEDLLGLTPKICPIHHRGLECKCRKSSNRQVWPWSTKWSKVKANRILPRECIGHCNSLFQKHKIQLYTWTSPNSQHWNQIDYILCSWRWRSSI